MLVIGLCCVVNNVNYHRNNAHRYCMLFLAWDLDTALVKFMYICNGIFAFMQHVCESPHSVVRVDVCSIFLSHEVNLHIVLWKFYLHSFCCVLYTLWIFTDHRTVLCEFSIIYIYIYTIYSFLFSVAYTSAICELLLYPQTLNICAGFVYVYDNMFVIVLV